MFKKVHIPGVKILNLVIFIVALAMLAAANLIPMPAQATGILTSLSCSLLGGSIVIFILSNNILNLYNIKQLMGTWGLESIYRSRKEVIKKLDKGVKTVNRELDCIIFGNEQFLKSQEKQLTKKLGESLKVRIITINPTSPYLEQLESELLLEPGSLKQGIEELTAWLNSMKEKVKKPEFLQIKYYDCLPLDFYLRVDGTIYTASYLNGVNPDDSITYSFCSQSQGYEYYLSYFEKNWIKL